MKICNKCNIKKDFSDFQKRKDSKDGYKNHCKECENLYQSKYQKSYYIKHIDIISKRKYSYRRTEEYRKRNKEFYINNKELVIYRGFINSTIKRLKTTKNNLRNIELVGYSFQDLKIHLEKLFLDGMNWENHGLWHIDHIKAVSKFEKGTPIKIINDLSNLQPLWAKDNLKKYNG